MNTKKKNTATRNRIARESRFSRHLVLSILDIIRDDMEDLSGDISLELINPEGSNLNNISNHIISLIRSAGYSAIWFRNRVQLFQKTKECENEK